jgi:beta-barrel assembly-enhancing protease
MALKNTFRPSPWLPALLVAALGLTPAWPQTLPSLGDSEGMSLSAERQLGDRIARELYRDPDYLEDPVLDEYIQRLWQPLVKAAAARGDLQPDLQARFAWRILLGRDRTVNAFALPGGYLGVHLGLIAVVGSDDELASVLAHELSHVTQRHIARSMDSQGKMSPLVIGSMLLGVLAASRSAQGAQALIVGGQAAAMQSQLSYSRDMEREADRVGYGVLGEAGYDPRGFVGMFGRLQQAAGVNDNGSFPYLRSHPLTTERIADMQARQELAPNAPMPAPNMVQAMMAGRARVLAQNTVDALRAWTQDGQLALASTGTKGQMPAQATHAAAAARAGALYAATLAHVQLRDMAAAERSLQALEQWTEGQPAARRLVRLLRAEMAFKQERFEVVLQVLAPQRDAAGGQRPELIATAQALVRLPVRAAHADVTRQLREWVTQAPQDAQAWNMLAGLQTVQGHTLPALRAEGEAQMARMDWQGAMDRFRAAQDWAKSHALQPGDHIEASIVDTRLREVQALIRAMHAERER